MISSLRCTGPARAGRDLAGRFCDLSRHRSWDLDPFAVLLRLPRVWSFSSDHEPTYRFHRGPVAGSGVRFCVPRTAPPAGGDSKGSGGVRLLGFGPVNQPCHADYRPRYSFQKGRSIHRPLLPWDLTPLPGSKDTRRKPSDSRCCRVPVHRWASVSLAPVPWVIVPWQPLLAPIRS